MPSSCIFSTVIPWSFFKHLISCALRTRACKLPCGGLACYRIVVLLDKVLVRGLDALATPSDRRLGTVREGP